MQFKLYLTFVVAMAVLSGIQTAAFGVLSNVLWNENFDSLTGGDLPSQDSTWSVVNNGVDSIYTEVNDTGIWPLVVPNGGKFGGHWLSTSTTENLVVTKDLSSMSPTSAPQMEYDFKMYSSVYINGDYRGVIGFLNVAKADGTPIAQMNFSRYGYNYTNTDVFYDLDGVTFATPSNDIHDFVIGLNFATQSATISVDGVDQGIVAPFMNPAVPGDFAQLNYRLGSNSPNAAKNYAIWVDNLTVSQNTPEPATVGLFCLGCLFLCARRHQNHCRPSPASV